MKVLVVLCAVVAVGLAEPNPGYAYSALSPLTGYSNEFAPFAYAYSAPIISHLSPYTAGLALPVKSQYHSQNELGMASYGHDEPGQSHHAIQDAEGNKYGSFSYVDHFGGVHQTRYYADAGGYRVESNDAPIGPAATLLHRRKRQAPQGQQWNSQPSWQNTPQQQSWNTQQQQQQPQPQAWQNDVPAAREQTWMPANTQAASLSQYRPAAASPSLQFTSQLQPAQASRAFFQPQPEAQSWQGPPVQPADIRVNADGTLRDTPEVAQAKELHFKEFARASNAASAAPESGVTAPAQFPAQEDDGSYKPELYNQGTDGRAWNSQPAQAPQPQWSGQEWNQQQAASPQSWNQQQNAPAQSWDQASDRSYQPQTQYVQPQTWSQPTSAPAVQVNQQPQATPYSAPWQQQQQPATQWSQPQAAQQWDQNQSQSWANAPTPAPQWNQGRSWESQPAAYNPQSNSVQDTPEVTAARQAHFQALADANRAQRNTA